MAPLYSPEWVRLRFSEIANQEATHVSFLTSALKAAGATPVQECTYDFGVDSPATYLALSQVLEGVGVAACTFSSFIAHGFSVADFILVRPWSRSLHPEQGLPSSCWLHPHRRG
jgi:hypothetical protein